MRTYSFDHFQADKPEPSVTNPGGAKQTPPAEEARPQVPPSEEGQLHYGRQHAQTAELYHRKREERERAQQMGAPAMEAAEPVVHDKEDVEQHAGSMPDASAREGLKDKAQQAVASVLQAAKEASKAGPLVGARKLATGVVSGALRVAREVSARRASARKASTKGPGKKR
jgi:hypothetical protein